jgi:hypothetical protein
VIQAPGLTGVVNSLFWLTHAQMMRLRLFSPESNGKPRVDERRLLGGIILINSDKLRGYDASTEHGQPKTL